MKFTSFTMSPYPMSLQRAVIFLLIATLEPGNAQIGLVNLTFMTFCFIATILPTFTAAPM